MSESASEDLPTPEFSRPFAVERLMAENSRVEVEADSAECAALAERFGLQAIRSLRGISTFEPLSGGRRLKAKVHILAEVVQYCVVTLDPVESTVDENIEIVFEPVHEGQDTSEVILDSLEDAEPLTTEILDMGELVATEMALALNPYPRAPEAGEIGPGAESGEEPKRPNPFEILGQLKSKR